MKEFHGYSEYSHANTARLAHANTSTWPPERKG